MSMQWPGIRCGWLDFQPRTREIQAPDSGSITELGTLTKSLAKKIGKGLAVLTSAFTTTLVVFFATGHGGSTPCGEDDWRWGLMQLFIGAPMLLASIITGAVAVVILRANTKPWAIAGLVILLQLGVSLSTLSMLQWPNVIYQKPACE